MAMVVRVATGIHDCACRINVAIHLQVAILGDLRDIQSR